MENKHVMCTTVQCHIEDEPIGGELMVGWKCGCGEGGGNVGECGVLGG